MTKRGTTSTALHMTTRGGLEFTVPVGARCIGRRLESGTRAPIAIWEIDPSSLPVGSIERHDATYYGLEVAPGFVIES